MRQLFTSLVLCVFAAAAFAETPQTRPTTRPTQVGWLTNYDKAIEQAKTEKKLVLADFTGSDWCGYCIKLKREVLDTPAFKQWAGPRVVLLELDFPRRKPQSAQIKQQNQQLQARYGVKGFPTVVFITPDGKEAGRIVGFSEAEKWTNQAHGIVEKAQAK